jgi:hypothetical protein
LGGILQIWHLTFSATGRWPLFDGESSRRAAVRLIAARVGHRLVLFCVVDDHLHVVVIGDRMAAGMMSRSLLFGLRAIASCPIEPAHIRPVRNRAHMSWLVSYLLGQTRKHRLPAHPALWSGSGFADLIGARVVTGMNLRLNDVLPRLQRRDILAIVGLADAQLPVPDGCEINRRRARFVASAAAAAVAADPAYRDRSRPTTVARRAAARLACEARLPIWRIARNLGVSPSMIRRLRNDPLDPRVVQATRRQMALMVALEESDEPDEPSVMDSTLLGQSAFCSITDRSSSCASS